MRFVNEDPSQVVGFLSPPPPINKYPSDYWYANYMSQPYLNELSDNVFLPGRYSV